MAHYVIFTKVVTLTLILIRFSPKKIARVLGTEYISCQHFRKIEQGCGLYIVQLRTDKQTNKQTDRGDQYTLQNSTILQSNNEACYRPYSTVIYHVCRAAAPPLLFHETSEDDASCPIFPIYSLCWYSMLKLPNKFDFYLNHL